MRRNECVLYDLDKTILVNLYNKAKNRGKSSVLGLLVETTGIEPVTPCMSSKYSNQLSYASVFFTTRLLYHKQKQNASPFLKFFDIFFAFLSAKPLFTKY